MEKLERDTVYGGLGAIRGRLLPDIGGKTRLLKRIIPVGNSMAVVIPKGWLETLEFPEALVMTVDTDTITLEPFIEADDIKLRRRKA